MAKKGKSDTKKSIADALLSTMMAVQLKRSVTELSFVELMKARKMNDRNTPWRNEWKNLIQEGYIQPKGAGGSGTFTSDYALTDKGEARAGSPEQKEIKRLMEATVNTTPEKHAQIRKLCMNKRSVQSFDLLLKHGSMTRKEIALMIGISDRGGPFSYGLRHLKQLGYIVEDTKNSQRGNKKLMLSDRCFMNPKDRPKPIPIDPKTMSDQIRKREEIYAAWLAKNPNEGAAVKKETAKVLQKEDPEVSGSDVEN